MTSAMAAVALTSPLTEGFRKQSLTPVVTKGTLGHEGSPAAPLLSEGSRSHPPGSERVPTPAVQPKASTGCAEQRQSRHSHCTWPGSGGEQWENRRSRLLPHLRATETTQHRRKASSGRSAGQATVSISPCGPRAEQCHPPGPQAEHR